jgi:hypothetical protein
VEATGPPGVLCTVQFVRAETDEVLDVAAPIVVGVLVVIRHPARGEFPAVVELPVRVSGATPTSPRGTTSFPEPQSGYSFRFGRASSTANSAKARLLILSLVDPVKFAKNPSGPRRPFSTSTGALSAPPRTHHRLGKPEAQSAAPEPVPPGPCRATGSAVVTAAETGAACWGSPQLTKRAPGCSSAQAARARPPLTFRRHHLAQQGNQRHTG